MDSDDQTDADFFDKLIDDDEPGAVSSTSLADDDEPGGTVPEGKSPATGEGTGVHTGLAIAQVPEAATLPRDFSSSSLADGNEPGATDPPVPDGGLPASGKGTGVHTGLANAQVPEIATLPRGFSSNSHPDHEEPGATDPPVPYGGSPGSGKGTGVHTAVKQAQWTSFGGDDNESDPFADLAGTDGFLGNMAGLDISAAGTSGASDHAALTTAVTDQDFFGSNTHHNTADGQLELSSSTGAVDSTDPKYLEAMYPGWKYDEATQQWYQVDGLDTSGNAQQPHDASHLQNSALGIIAEEGATTATVSSWAASEYPPNMLFYAEYPGWYYDTNTQQWHSLESYQQAAMQPGTASALQNGTIYNVTAASTAMDYSAYQTENSEVSQQNSSTNSYAHQSQGQADAFANTMQYDAATDGSVTSSFYGFGQQANAGSVSASTSHQDGLYQVHDHHKGLETSSLQSGYNSTDSQQSSYNAFDPSAAFQASYKAFEPATSNQTRQKVFEPSTTNRGGYKAFQPSLGNQSDYKAFEPSTANHAGYKGFMPSTVSQTGYKESESYKGFETSSVQHAGYIATQSSSGQLSGYTGFETSTNHGYTDQNSYLGAEKQANEYQGGHLSNSYLGTENSMNFTQEQFFGAHASQMQFSPSPHEGRSSAGRPPHAIVSFGFGGKLIVMKESSSMAANFNSGNQGNSSGTVSLLNLSEVIDKAALASSTKSGVFSYFQALCRQPVPGPLVGGSAASKDVNKWLDEMIAWYESSSNDFQRPDTRKLLISLLKILCQHYGKLRSPFGSDPQEESNGPEMAVTKLFSSCKKSRIHMGNYGSIMHCMKNIPAESQIQAVAQEVQSLLVSGRRKEALQCAQGGQLWGPAIILALQLGDQFYVDTVKKMAHSHFVAGSPLRTLCLLIAGQPADVFTADNNIKSDYTTLGASHQSLESGPNGMLNDWEENLAIITANRTKGDDLVITHLGDCLWKERYEVAAAHSCYLVAELNIDSYSESARLCLIGADHLKCPRTYVSPEAIQRTEVYEHAKVLGNSQYILLPFQPYKLIYAYMLVEVGRISDSLRYCQASMKVLKASGRAPELETWKQLFSSLEERIRTHQQGGYGTNLGPAKLVGKIFPSLDKSISRMMGTQSAPLPPLVQGSISDRESYFAPAAAKFGNNQSVMAVSSLIPSASTQSMSEIAENSNGGPGSKVTHNRSVSEPDFGRTPKQGTGSDSTQSNASGSGSSRFGWLGSTLQKTMGLVSKSHRQAKLGEQNKFYYDEKLKRWVEEGAAIPAEEPPLPPPPSRSSFQNGLPDQKLNGPMSGSHAPNGIAEWRSSNSSEHGSGMPPIPPSQNQFSARGRMGVRSRYVDTFNKTGASGAMPSYNKPAAPSAVPPAGAKFFMPTAVSASEDQLSHEASEVHSETVHLDERSASPPAETSFSSPLPSAQSSEPVSSTIHRHPSMDSISTPYQGSGVSAESGSSSFSRSRAASWSGTYSEPFSASAGARSPDGQTMPVPVMPGQRPPPSRSNSSSSAQLNGLTEDLHEVEL